MDEKRKIISDILSGKTSVPDAQKKLGRISLEDAETVFRDGGLSSEFDAYREEHRFFLKGVPAVSREEINDIWENAVGETGTHRETILKKIIKWTGVGDMAPYYGKRTAILVFTCLLVVLFSPMILENKNSHKHPSRVGMKGENAVNNASLEYAIVSADGRLARPDRDLTEEDTIAFRLTFQTDGFGALYILNDGRIEKLFSGRYFNRGCHDLDFGYQLEGNAGENRIVLVHSFEPLDIEEKELQTLMLATSRNTVSSMTIGENLITFSYETLHVVH